MNYKNLKKEDQLELPLKMAKVVISMKKLWAWAKVNKKLDEKLHQATAPNIKTYVKTAWTAYQSWKDNYMKGSTKAVMPDFVGWAN